MVFALQSSTGDPPPGPLPSFREQVVCEARKRARRAQDVVESLTPEQRRTLIEVGPYLDVILRDVEAQKCRT